MLQKNLGALRKLVRHSNLLRKKALTYLRHWMEACGGLFHDEDRCQDQASSILVSG